ncbi:rod-binding protein [Methylocystis sp. IM3]|uniref:rod-binding protein n=1 Tax=unclassified Methylocystis TaxID=2625913 RepID=UPI000FAAAF25|nr:MAG: hypothetical protein EKK29_13710 [Hyphomicrobiales bacterium]
MSIFPATDIVSDVARAADPGKSRLAMKRLEEIGGEKAQGTGNSFVVATRAPPPPSATPPTTIIDSGVPNVARSDTLSPTQKFEAFLLQSWLENVMPRGDGVYGAQAGADIWRSMMADQISSQLARADVMGLQKLLEHPNSAVSAKRA